MKAVKTNTHIRCDCGVCRNSAELAIEFDFAGADKRLYMCADCARKVSKVLSDALALKKEARQ